MQKKIRTETLKKMVSGIMDTGKFFSITFRKNDGSVRTAVCKKVVKRILKGGKRTVPDNYLFAVDINKLSKGIRPYVSFKPESIIRVKCGDVLVKN